MPCSGCAERRKQISQAWMRIKGLMSNGLKPAELSKADQETLARAHHHDPLRAHHERIAKYAILPKGK